MTGIYGLVLWLLFTVCYCKSIQNQQNPLNETHDDRIANLEKIVRTLESRINALNETDHKRLVYGEPVMFYAIIYNKGLTLNVESTVVFEKIIVNIGNNYNQYDGVFVAPRKGVYLFSWTISVNSGSYAITELVVENDVISSAGDSGANNGYRSTSMTALCRMNKGDHAFIRTTGLGATNVIYSNDNYPRSSFLGIIVRDEKSLTLCFCFTNEITLVYC